MSNLLNHAKREMQRVGLYDENADYGPAIAECVEELIRTFSKQGHSGGSAQKTMELFNELVRYRNLGPITDDPEEWMEIQNNLHQNRRNHTLFSKDGGRIYYSVDDPNRATMSSIPYEKEPKK